PASETGDDVDSTRRLRRRQVARSCFVSRFRESAIAYASGAAASALQTITRVRQSLGGRYDVRGVAARDVIVSLIELVSTIRHFRRGRGAIRRLSVLASTVQRSHVRSPTHIPRAADDDAQATCSAVNFPTRPRSRSTR